MITYLLLMMIKMKSIIDFDFLEILRRIESALDKRIDIYDLFNNSLYNKPPPPVIVEKWLF